MLSNVKKIVHKALKYFSLLTVSIVLSLIAVEGLLRVTNYQMKPSIWSWTQNQDDEFVRFHNKTVYKLDSRRIWSMVPGVYINEYIATDLNGFRFNPRHTHGETQESIIVVGDSFAWGCCGAYTEAFPYFLETFLQKNNPSLIVHNAGSEGYGPDQEFVYLMEDVLPAYTPKKVVWTFYANDIWDANEACLFRKNGAGYLQLPAWLNSLYWHGVIVRIAAPLGLKNSRIVDAAIWAPERLTGLNRFTVGCSNKDGISREDFVAKVQYFITEANKKITAMGSELLVVIAPFEMYVDPYPDQVEQGQDMHGYLVEALDIPGVRVLDANQEFLKWYQPAALSETESSSSAALGDEVAAEGQPRADFFLAENIGFSHLNDRGNEFFAEIVATALLHARGL